MDVRVLYFAGVRDLLGVAEEEFCCDDGATLGALVREIATRHPGLEARLAQVAFAVDQEFATAETPLADGCEVALIPPLGGGEDPEPTGFDAGLFRIMDRPADMEEVVRLVVGDFAGAIVTFTGIVRRLSHDREISSMEYEAYQPMAEAKLKEVALEVRDRWPTVRLAIHHRIGRLGIGDTAVVIAACAPHRKEAFQACERAIDRLKETAPIWKKEIGQDGETWVGWGP